MGMGGRPEEDIRLEPKGHYLHRLCTEIRPFWLSRLQECLSTSLKGQYRPNQLGKKNKIRIYFKWGWEDDRKKISD